jgi:ubiquinone/menaquinone biosynthesis C-methylase UbiE
MSNEAINQRYTLLSEDESCCLSCGGAVHRADPRLGEVCVDLGCGRGNDVMRLAEAVGPEGHVYGIDLSDGMIAKAKANLAKFEVTNATIVKAELEHLPLLDGSVDLVISNCTINHAADKQGVWDEVYRVLRRGGRFVVSDIYATAPIPEEYRNDPEAVAECWAGSVTKPEYLQMLLKAGFKEIRILEESKPYGKGKAEVCSFTISGIKRSSCSCCC